MSPERSGTPHDEAVFSPKMSVPASPVAGTPIREAQSPISLLLAVAQSQNRQHADDDLTSLSWLHEGDILKGINFNPSPSNSVNSTPVKNGTSLLQDQSPTSDYVDDSSVSAADSSNSSVHSPVPYQNQSSSSTSVSGSVQRNKHPHNVPYDPLVHTTNKPPFSFSCLIFMAIEDSSQKALPVKEIYAWILDHFPYFKNAPTGWKNSVRHNLSLNKCFQKVEKAPNLGKGSLWTVDPQYKPNLIQALTRSPFHPCSTLDPSTYFGTTKTTTAPPVQEKPTANRLPNPELFPFLSKKLAATSGAQTRVKTEPADDSLDAVDAAAVMLSLKNGPRYRQKKDKYVWQVITTSPSQDHTYSAAEGGEEAVATDEAFESEEERVPKSSICRKIDFEDEEERRIKEGAETLLNLAGITTRKRHNSGMANGEEKRLKLSPRYDINKNVPEEKPTPFKPRLLRTKKKECKPKILHSNNNDEWVKHRRELEINQYR